MIAENRALDELGGTPTLLTNMANPGMTANAPEATVKNMVRLFI